MGFQINEIELEWEMMTKHGLNFDQWNILCGKLYQQLMPNLVYLSGIFYFYLLFAQFGVFIGNIARRHTEIRGNLQRAGEDKSCKWKATQGNLGCIKAVIFQITDRKMDNCQFYLSITMESRPKHFPVQKGALLASLGNEIFCLCSKNGKGIFSAKLLSFATCSVRWGSSPSQRLKTIPEIDFLFFDAKKVF